MGSWSPQERRKRAKKCVNPKGFTMKQFCKNLKSKSKKGQKGNELSSPVKKKSPVRSRTPGP